jgi:hypothetical protein
MSEPTETGGLPLDLRTYQQQQPTGSIIHQPTPPSVEYCKTTQSPNDNAPKGPKTTSPRRRPGTIKQAPSGPHTGSSRSEQHPALSPTDMSSQSSSIHYTRTGRISKAKKGLKVHNCENCGRVSPNIYILLPAPECRRIVVYGSQLLHSTSSQLNVSARSLPIPIMSAVYFC